jgi:hypothetical protein
MNQITTDSNLIANCGLYCGACRSYLKGKCPGCRENTKATWCKIRTCCAEQNFRSCADCQITDLTECKKFDNFISKIFAVLFNSDRKACINAIREKGYDQFAADMAASGKQSINRKK